MRRPNQWFWLHSTQRKVIWILLKIKVSLLTALSKNCSSQTVSLNLAREYAKSISNTRWTIIRSWTMECIMTIGLKISRRRGRMRAIRSKVRLRWMGVMMVRSEKRAGMSLRGSKTWWRSRKWSSLTLAVRTKTKWRPSTATVIVYHKQSRRLK